MPDQKPTLEYRTPEPRRRLVIHWGKHVFLDIIVMLSAVLAVALSWRHH